MTLIISQYGNQYKSYLIITISSHYYPSIGFYYIYIYIPYTHTYIYIPYTYIYIHPVLSVSPVRVPSIFDQPTHPVPRHRTLQPKRGPQRASTTFLGALGVGTSDVRLIRREIWLNPEVVTSGNHETP